MSFIADLHIHSHFSRATSAECTLEGLQRWAQLKGVRVVGTGDCTHPGWFEELRGKLVPSRPGLYRLRDDLAAAVDAQVPASCRGPVEFMVSGEISSIYKRAGQTRRVHSLILLPDLDSAARLNARLGALGNIRSDGRPILGVDPRDLLTLLLEAHADGLFIPAHIWTPWFSMLGSMSGFDSAAECFGDLVGQIPAVETGLSSDPPMNWRVSSLDRFALVSNSDLHSPANLGRNASVFHGDVDYFAMRRALCSKASGEYGGSIDLFPEEGKYHADGHRKCNVCLEPDESLRLGGLCPVCGKPLVLGVLHRVMALADRPPGIRPSTASDHEYIIPLPELLAELLGCGATSRKVTRAYETLLVRLGPELRILRDLPGDAFAVAEPALLGEAIRRVRAGQVIRTPGYDGEYGTIRVFQPGEMDELRRQGLLLRVAASPAPSRPPPAAAGAVAAEAVTYRLESAPPATRAEVRDDLPAVPLTERDEASGQLSLFGGAGVLAGLDREQRRAAAASAGPLLIVAGPGTGKTRTLTHRIAHLVVDRQAAPESILAVTFTNRAAGELRERLQRLLGEPAAGIAVGTFHALCLQWLRRGDPWSASAQLIDDDQERDLMTAYLGPGAVDVDGLQRRLADRRRGADPGTPPDEDVARWEAALQERCLLPLDGIIPRCLAWLSRDPAARRRLAFTWICVDEFQDINPAQYRLVRELAGDGRGLCVIGDPDQSIYGFRGSDPRCFEALRAEFPAASVFRLERNHRSSGTLVSAAAAVMAPGRTELSVVPAAAQSGGLAVRLHAASSVAAEAEFIAHEIEQWLGGTAHFSLDSGRVSESSGVGSASFADVAVLVRLKAMVPAYAEALSRLGIPLQTAGADDPLHSPGIRQLLAVLRDRPRDALAQTALSALAEPALDGLLTAADRRALAPLLRPAASPPATLAEVLDGILLRVPGDASPVHAEQVNLLTMHAAKGLEFPIVFVAGCEDGIVPYRRDGETSDIAEERRLLYVAMTRARQALYLTRSRRRALFGRSGEAPPSPFLSALPADSTQVMEAPRRSRPGGGAVQLEFDLG